MNICLYSHQVYVMYVLSGIGILALLIGFVRVANPLVDWLSEKIPGGTRY